MFKIDKQMVLNTQFELIRDLYLELASYIEWLINSDYFEDKEKEHLRKVAIEATENNVLEINDVVEEIFKLNTYDDMYNLIRMYPQTLLDKFLIFNTN